MEKKESKLKKILSITSTILFVVSIVIIVCVTAFSLYNKGRDKVAYVGNKAIVVVLSNSMEPDFTKGDYILIKKVDPNQLKVGDVITFISDDPSIKGKLNTHQIIDIKDGKFITKGKNNSVQDNYPVDKSNVKGIVVKKLVVLGAVLRFLLKPYGFILLIFVPMLGIISMYIVDFVKALKEKRLEDKKAQEKLLLESTIQELKESGKLDDAIASYEKAEQTEKSNECKNTEKTDKNDIKS